MIQMKLKIGIINGEFFREDLGGFGGYGSLARYLTLRYNTREDSPFEFVVLLMRSHNKKYIREHASEVYPLVRSVPPIKFVEYHKRIKKLDVDMLLSVEFSQGYLYGALQKNDTPLVIWLQDPRSEVEWRKIATSPFIYQKEAHGANIKNILRGYKRAIKVVMGFNKKVEFATQARFLRYRGYLKYQTRKSLSAKFLPNPIEIPKDVAFKDKSETPTILFLGRLDPIKRPWIYFEIAKKLPQYNFLVAGIPHDYEYMKEKINPYRKLPNLRFLGLVTGTEKDRLLRKSWILVNTSIHEALPVSFLEAFSYKIPVVSCQNPDKLVSEYGIYTGEVLGDGYSSVLKFVEAIKNLVEDETLRKKLGQKARRYVIRYHTFQKFEKKIYKIYKELNQS